jgi:multidrug efflux pump subunit AcrB
MTSFAFIAGLIPLVVATVLVLSVSHPSASSTYGGMLFNFIQGHF